VELENQDVIVGSHGKHVEDGVYGIACGGQGWHFNVWQGQEYGFRISWSNWRIPTGIMKA
jgi:hypothetical protein